jgi:hypothetical protein
MKTKLLVLIASAAMLGAWPAKANTYTYNVDFDIAGQTVTGTIMTNADTGYLNSGDLLSWSFQVGASSIMSSTTGASETDSFAATGVTPLLLSSSQITYSPITAPFGSYSNLFCGDLACDQDLFFNNLVLTRIVDDIAWSYSGTSYETKPAGFTVIATIATTPVPAALPLFATGLSALGLLGWRKKRKSAAIAA